MTQWYRTHPPMQVMWAHSLGWKDPLEREMATHSGMLVWEIPWTEVWYSSKGFEEMDVIEHHC